MSIITQIYLFLLNFHQARWHFWSVEFFNEVNFTDLNVLPLVYLFLRGENFISRSRNKYEIFYLSTHYYFNYYIPWFIGEASIFLNSSDLLFTLTTPGSSFWRRHESWISIILYFVTCPVNYVSEVICIFNVDILWYKQMREYLKF